MAHVQRRPKQIMITKKLILILLILLAGFSCKHTINNELVNEPGSTDTLASDSITYGNPEMESDTIIILPVGNQGLEIDTADLDKLLVYIPYEKSSNGYQIEKYAFQDPWCSIPFFSKYRMYYANRNLEFMFSDTLVSPIHMESESGQTGFTIWKLTEGKYRLICLLDGFIPNYARVDSVFNLAKGKYLITGTASWGDQGDNSGYFWVAAWDDIRSFRIIHMDKWFTPASDSVCDKYSYSYFFRQEKMLIELKKIKETYDCNNYPERRLNRVVKNISIDLNKCILLDRTEDF